MIPKTTEQICITELAETPLGPLWLAASARGLIALGFDSMPTMMLKQIQRRFKSIQTSNLRELIIDLQLPLQGIIARSAKSQVEEYLSGHRHEFNIPIDWTGLSAHQIKVLQATLAINYGVTKTYAQIASQIDHPKSARAVGRAQATNPMPIVIPCHRVIGSDGSLHGYSGRGGTETKAWLLALEASHRNKDTHT